MLTQFAVTAESLSKASALMFRIGSDAHLYDDPDDVSIAPLLDSKFDSEKCEALKRLLALIAQGIDVSTYFPQIRFYSYGLFSLLRCELQVVKNVASQSLEVKKLVYLYLLHYTEKRPDETLLSINCFQKDIGHPNPLVRAWALRTMAGIRLHVIAPIVIAAVGKCARDPSVYVRICAANALPKLHDLRLEEHVTAIEEIVGLLLKDNSPGVVGAAAAAFASICPNNLTLIKANFRRLCETLPDVEEWGQVVLIGILLRYVIAKHGLVQESIMLSSSGHVNRNIDSEEMESHLAIQNFGCDTIVEIADILSSSYLEGPDKYLSKSRDINQDSIDLDMAHFTSAKSNDDLKIFLQCTSPLLWSYNSAVVLASAGVHWIMAPKEDIQKIVKPLLFLLRSSSSSKYVVLCNIQVFAKAMPSLFAPHFEDFFVSSSDSYQMKTLKLEILSSIATDSSISSILLEFQDYVRDPNRRFAADAVAAIGFCTLKLPDVANTCLEGLLTLALSESLHRDGASFSEEEIVLVQAIKSIRLIIKQDPPSHEKVIVNLVRSLDSIRAPAARAMVIWMLGEYNNIGSHITKMIPTIYKYLAWRFKLEEVEPKLQIINSCIKVILHAKGEDVTTVSSSVEYILELAKFDMNYDVRDRARVVKKFLSSSMGFHSMEEVKYQRFQFIAECMFGRQAKLLYPEPLNHRFYLPGSLSQIVLHAAPGYEPLPKPCSLMDDEVLETNTKGVGAAGIEPNEIDSSDTVLGSLDEENTSDHSSQVSVSYSSDGDDIYDDASAGNGSEEADPLIHLSDGAIASRDQIEGSEKIHASSSTDFGELMSKRDLESWLNENPTLSQNEQPNLNLVRRSFARISIKDIGHLIKPKTYTLLDPANGSGLSVDYVFSSEVSSISPQHLCLQVSFRNYSTEPISNILLSEEEFDKSLDSSENSISESERSLVPRHEVPSLLPMEEIASLEPGQTTNRALHVCFRHHLVPLKLVLWCNGEKRQVKLRPNIGNFIKPLPMDTETFSKKELQLRGMLEYIKKCAFTDHIGQLNDRDDPSFVKDKVLTVCEKIALKMLSNANLFLVTVDMPVATKLDDLSGLCLRFSGEILSNLIPCLITLIIEGTCSEQLEVSVKVNCEETVFGLNLLNRIVNILADPTS
ncbi:hypothetical protein F511_32003 [Dorcoceras hygrometricum]|uniref:AP-3 complex subunit beta n=1 Tax=Dorcoceras hygrometricum TaxID=472368 RepID=A0A2Z7D8P0_9LAMI|nr:hypothetical protein F511_32003 [Dorcoceras hygrometricum]